tara:strand:+ start:457 stop:708 length:252 start_codon:yes stop_codon:yes gene_type:complete
MTEEVKNKRKRTSSEDFVVAWQKSESRQEVANKLEITYGAVSSREKNFRKAGVHLKEMPKAQRGIGIDANHLNNLIDKCNSQS